MVIIAKTGSNTDTNRRHWSSARKSFRVTGNEAHKTGRTISVEAPSNYIVQKPSPIFNPHAARELTPLMSPEESEYRRTIVFRAKKLYRAIKDETDEYNRLDNLYRGETITSLESTADELEAIASDRGSVARVLDLRKAADMKRQRTFVPSHFSPNGTKTNFVKFMAVAERLCPEEARDPEVATLAMCYCTKSEKNPDGIFTVFPKGAI